MRSCHQNKIQYELIYNNLKIPIQRLIELSIKYYPRIWTICPINFPANLMAIFRVSFHYFFPETLQKKAVRNLVKM